MANCTITGNIFEPDNDPLSGATLKILSARLGGTILSSVPVVQTSSAGAFTFTAPQGAIIRVQGKFSIGNYNFREPIELVVPASSTANLEDLRTPSDYLTGASSNSACTISGTILKPDGTVYAGATFKIVRAYKNGIQLSSIPVTVTADSNGDFTFDAVQGSVIRIKGNFEVGDYDFQNGLDIWIPQSSSATFIGLLGIRDTIDPPATGAPFVPAINTQTTATVDAANDYFTFYDASAGAHRRVLGSNLPGGGGGGTWGSITGTLGNQTDLQAALDAKQAADADLTAIAALSPTNDDIIQRKAGAWTNRTIAQLKTDLNYAAIATSGSADDLSAGTVPLARLSGITNTEISASAAIAYSKLNLTGAILNADLAGSIANAKLANSSITIAGSATSLGGSITASAILDSIGSTQGQVLYRGASGWGVLSPGSSGQVLQTQGASANPQWATVSASPGGSSGQFQYNNSGAFGGTTGVTYGGSNLVAMTKDATVDSILKVAETGTTPTGLVGGSPTIVSLVTNAGSFYALGYIDETNDRAIANYVSAPTLAFDFYQLDNTYLGGTYLLDYGGISLDHATHSKSSGYGILYQTGDNIFALGRSSDLTEANGVDDLTWGTRGITQRAPATAIIDGDLLASHLHFYLDESGHTIKVKAKESGGTVLSATLGSGGGLTVGSTAIASGTGGRLLYETAGNVVGEISGATSDGTTVTLTSPTVNTGITLNAAPLTMSGNISAAAWTTNGIRIKGVAATLTDTTSSGTVAAAYTNVYGGNTIAASSSTTFTDYYTTFITQPTAGTNVTFTRRWALGLTGAQLINASSANAFVVGPNGITNPTLTVVTNVASAATGLSITGNAVGSGVTLTALSSGTNENVVINPKGEGFIRTYRTAGSVGGFQSTDSSGNVGAWMYLSGTSGRLYAGYGGEISNYTGAAGTSNRYAAWYTNNFDVNANFIVRWFSGANIDIGSADIGLARSAAGVLRITNGSTGAGNLLIGTSAGAIGTSGAGVLAFANSTAPTSSPADVAQLWAADMQATAGNHGLHLRNEINTAALILPGVRYKTDTGDPTDLFEGMFVINTFDNTAKIYADGALRTIATW